MVTVNDDDVLLARITAGISPITEGTAATFTVTLDLAAPAGGLTISVDVTESGSYIAGSAPETVVIAEGATTGTLTVSTEDDSLDESDGAITVRITTGTGYTVGTTSTAMVTVNDNDVVPSLDDPVVSISAAAPTTITEGAAATFTVALDRAAPADGLTVSVDVTESGSYIAGSAPTTVVIAEGATTGTLTVPTADDNLDEPDGSITVRITTGAGYTVGTPSTALVTVNDNDIPDPDAPVVSISAAAPTTITEGEVATFTVALDRVAPADGLTISVDVTESGSYIVGSAPTTVVIAEGATTGTLTVPTADDNLDEPDGSITVRITTGAGYTVGTPSTALVTVSDNDVAPSPDAPVARISAADPTTITEGEGATFTVALDRTAPAGGLTISVDVTESGSYIAGSAPATVVIAEGATTGTLTVPTADDNLDERDGSITVRITTGTGYTVGTPSTALVTVNDNDVLLARISAAAPTTITEGEVATFRVTLSSAAPADGLTISVAVTESGSYIADSAPTTVVIAEGATTGTLTVSTDDDNLDESDGSITVRITTGAGYTVGTPSTAMVTVNDNDIPDPDAPVARITATDPTTITEGTAATFRVTLSSAAAAGGLTISVAVTESGSYIAGSAPMTVAIAVGATTGTLTVSTDDDEMIEETGSITVRITTGASYTVAAAPDNQAEVTVLDNDTPIASITAADPTTITEGAAATFRVALDRAAPADGLTISVEVTQSGSYIDSSTPTEVFITVGVTTGTLTVMTEDDAADEADGSITAVINAGAGYAVGTPNTAMVTVNDDDVLLARITATDPTTITEGTAATFTVTLDLAAPAGGLTISVGVTQSGSYIEGSAPATVVIAEGATTGTLTVSTEDDNRDEPTGSITAELNAGAGYTVGTPSTAMVTVNDNDVAPSPDAPVASISAAGPTTITEGTAATFTVALDRAAPAGGLTVSVDVTESGSYIADLAPATVVIASGATTVTLAVSTEDDEMGERSGSITVRITTGAGYTVGVPSTATVTVNDDDVLLASISAADPTTITEGTAATFTVALDQAAPASGLTISVGVTESGSYIAGSAPATVIIAVGATTGTLTVSTEDDSIDEADGSITAELNAGAGYTVGTPSTAMVTVNDDDVLLASITAADPTTITEGEVATFRVTLGSAAPAGGLTISVDVTESGSYIAGSAPATVVIAEGATTGTLTVPTADDNLDEPDGAITVRITTGAGYTVGTLSTALVTVNDNDIPDPDAPVVSITAADPTTITEGEVATFRVSP